VAVAQDVDLPGHEGGLVVLAVRDVPDDLGAVPGVGPQVLGAAGRVLGDDRVGGLQDGLGRAVVLLEQDRRGVRVVLLELDDVADRRPAERVDGLVGVADDAQLGRRHRGLVRLGDARADQLLDQHVLGVVGVLVFVDEHVPEAAPIVLRDVGKRLQDVDRRHDEVVEVEGVGLAETPLVAGVGLRQHPVGVIALLHPGREGLLVDQLVLEVGDLRGEAARGVTLGIQVEVAHDQPHEALAVGGVVDREARLQAHVAGLAAQDPHAGAVEGAHPHGLGARPDERLDALAHLRGGLVGERDREDLPGLDVARGQQVGDAVRQHPGLARPGARHDEQRTALVHHGLALLRVEPLQQGVRVGALVAGPRRLVLAPARRPPVVRVRSRALVVRRRLRPRPQGHSGGVHGPAGLGGCETGNRYVVVEIEEAHRAAHPRREH
jgi:hypothetical protein